MKSYTYIPLFLLFVGSLLLTCDDAPTGDFVENNAPDTFLTLSRIDREGEFRLSSQIEISWWGTDSDGYIVGYEYAINDTSEGNWSFTTRTDSTFILPITEGQSEDDVLFKVRAIDNDGAVDPDGARLVYPVVNTPPTVTINTSEIPSDTLFSIASFGWTIEDIDGLGNIARTEIVVNDTTAEWITIPISEEENSLFISLEIDNTTPGEKTADVFTGRNFSSAPDIKIPGLQVGELNTFYVRVVDNAGEISPIDSVSWFIKQKKSSTLFLNDIFSASSVASGNYHLGLLQEIGIEPDVWLINDEQILSGAFPAIVDPTLKRTLAEWDHIYWVSNDIARNITFALETTDRFFDNGGTMFATIPMKAISQNSEIFNFIPVDSIGVLTGIQTGFLINSFVDVTPMNGIAGPTLSTTSSISGSYPLKHLPGSTPLYETDFRATTIIGVTQDYTRDETVAIENSEGNLIYFGFDLSTIDGNDNVAELLELLLIDRLEFKQ